MYVYTCMYSVKPPRLCDFYVCVVSVVSTFFCKFRIQFRTKVI